MSMVRLLIYFALLVSHLGLVRLGSCERPAVEEPETIPAAVPGENLVPDGAATPAATETIVPTESLVVEQAASRNSGSEQSGGPVSELADKDASFRKKGKFAAHDEDDDPVEIVAIGQQTWHARTTPELLHLAGLDHSLEPEQSPAEEDAPDDAPAEEEHTPGAKMREVSAVRDDETNTLTPNLVVIERGPSQPDLELIDKLDAERPPVSEPQEPQEMVQSKKAQLYLVSENKKLQLKKSLQ
eukprot:TRINITY_DN60173_c0_g1_i1.p1 TRINITY_DN60173_c0_g1~~TRINITY_DN60173_c0_g1_i1.p1  ORF type:complete len:242 (+),score=61.26 TRINITY_DN60173_c0_g1_i1:71-796(+)